jgi:hypothetical protein
MGCLKLTYQAKQNPLKIAYKKASEKSEKVVQGFISVDPLAADYPFYTPYNYAGNKPVNKIDIDGMQEGDKGGGGTAPAAPSGGGKVDYELGKGAFMLPPQNTPPEPAETLQPKTITELPVSPREAEIKTPDPGISPEKMDSIGKAVMEKYKNPYIHGIQTGGRIDQDNTLFGGGGKVIGVAVGNILKPLVKWVAKLLKPLAKTISSAISRIFTKGTRGVAKGGKFTQSAADDLVVGLRKQYGGNVTVMKDGQPIFRVHQPGTHGNAGSTITKFSQHTSPQGVSFPRPDPKVTPFDQGSFDILNQAINGKGGYSIITKGGR